MDWDLKMPVSWDLAELDHDAVPAIAAPAPAVPASSIVAAAAAASARGPPSRPECSVDLKLGGLGEFGAGAMKEPAARAPVVPVSTASAAAVVPSASPRPRPRPGTSGGGGAHCPSCAVDGCRADLSRCRDYHRRHKVCEAHSKTPLVVVAGREMRFCQQCSRFHMLAEFDEAKRSCRKRLDGHNRRRRKPQVDSMNSGSFMTTQQGTRFASSFPAPRPEQSWSGIIKTEDTSPYYTHHPLLTSSCSSSRHNFAGSTSSSSYSREEGRRFPFLHDGDQLSFSTGAEIPVCQPLLKAAMAPPPPESSSSNCKTMFSDGQLTTHMLDSDCALSLLSSPANSSSVVVDVSRMVRPTEHVPSAAAPQHLVPNLHFGSNSSAWFACSQASSGVSAAAGFGFPGMESEQLNTALVPSSNDNDMNCHHGIFHVGAEGSSDGTSPSLQFSWQ